MLINAIAKGNDDEVTKIETLSILVSAPAAPFFLLNFRRDISAMIASRFSNIIVYIRKLKS